MDLITILMMLAVFAAGFASGYATCRRRLHVLLAWLGAAGPAVGGTPDVWAVAAADLNSIDPEARCYQRYLTDYAIPSGDEPRGNFELTFRYHWNSLSKESEFDNPVVIHPDVYRVDLRLIGMDPATWERLADVEPYYHERIIKAHLVKPYGRAKKIERKKSHLAIARWVPREAADFLVEHCQSQVPLVRADWFWAQTVIQEKRRLGYYDILGFKSRRDFEKLVGLSVKLARSRKDEVASIIKESGVARWNRQIFRFGSTDSGAWRTLDVLDDEVGRRNAIRNLDDDFVHQAEEHYGFLPNFLFAFFLCNADGSPQDKAPQEIGGDAATTSKDINIHCYLSCVRCHKEGLRPLNDYARKMFQAPGGLSHPNFKRFLRKRQLYLGELQFRLTRDNQLYEFHLAKLTGWKPAQLSAAYTRWWKWYYDTPVTIQQAAIESGFTPKAIQEEMTRRALAPPAGLGKLDPGLAEFGRDPPGTIKRQHWEEIYPTFQRAMRGDVDP